MKKLLLFLCLLVQTGVAETPRIDSLKWELGRLDKQPNGYAKDTLRAQTLRAIMRGYADVKLDSAFYYNSLLMRLCSDRGLQKELIYANHYRGILFQMQGNHHQSIHFHYEALLLAEKQRQYPQMAAAYAGAAQAYSSLNRDTLALQFCNKGLVLLRSYPNLNVYQEQLAMLNVQGWVYVKLGRFTESLNVSQEMYQLARKKPGDPWYEAHGLHAIGLAYKGMGDMTKAIAYHEKALTLLRSSQPGSVELEGNILVNIADIYIRQKNWRQALVYCNQGKQMASRAKNSKIVAEANGQLYVIYKNLGDPEKALKAHEDYILLKDSLSKEENQQRIDMLRAQYDNVQKTNALKQERLNRQAEQNRSQQTRNGLFLGLTAILLVAVLLFWNNKQLQAKNREIDQQRSLLETARRQLADINKSLETRVDERTAELVKANQELIQTNEKIKEALFKGQTIERKRVALELHDNLSSLLSAVNMSIQSINPQNLSEPEQSVYRNVKQLIQNAYAEVRNISHNILPIGLEREGLVPTLRTLIDQLNQNSSLQFSLMTMGLNERLPVKIEFNVYSIVWELINNAIKHAKATTISIDLRRTDFGIELVVTDDGIGLGKNQAKPGIGLQNIQTRLDSLGGTFDVLMPTGKGTRIGIKIPIETVHVNGNASVV